MTATLDRLRAALAGRYDVRKEIGAGGMATVFLGHDIKHDRDVAIKVLHPDLGAALGSERFLSEIKTTAKLQHPHILPLLDSGEADGLLYYVMPVVTGESLRVRLEREGQLSINEAIRIAKETASALDYAHRHGVIHRDIKPENILLHDSQAIVGDFGIALAVSAAGGSRMTQTGLSLGTPQYMSPEQAMGERAVDARSDIYSLGAVTYEMLTGDPPFTGSNVQAIVSKIMTQRPTPISAVRDTVPETVENAVMIALAKLPADRFATAAEFSTALTSPTTAFARTSGELPRSGPGRRKLDVIGQRFGIPAIAIAILASALALWGWMRPQPPKQVVRYMLHFDSSNALSGNGRRFALSDDGTMFAYTGGSDTHLFIRPRNSLSVISLPGTAGAATPFFSPDGKQIGYTTFNFELKVVSLDGGAPVTISDSIVGRTSGTWSSDGFIYIHPRMPGALVRLRPVQEAKIESFTRLDSSAHELSHSYPSALPDSKGVVFTVTYKDKKQVSIAVADRSGKHTVLLDGFFPQYSASGHLLYISSTGALMAVPFDADKLRLTGDPFLVVESSGASPFLGSIAISFAGVDARVSSNGTLIYSPRTFKGGELEWVDRAGRATSVDSSWRAAVSFFSISPEGHRLAVGVSDATGAHIWIKQLDRGPARKLTLSGANDNYPSWTPDGNFVSYYSDVGNPEFGLWKKKADASAQPIPLSGFHNPVESEWSRDGKWLIFRTSVQGSGKGDSYAIRSGDTTPVTIVATPAAEQEPAISPDGKWLAYTSNETGRFEVYVVPFPNASSAKWPVSTGGGTEPAWSHSGRELFYRDGAGNMVSTPVVSSATFATGAPHVLFSAIQYASGPAHRNYDVSPDDQRFLMLRSRPEGESDSVIVVENWFEELKHRSKK